MAPVRPDSAQTSGLLDRLREGDPAALEGLLARHRPALRAFVAARLDPRLAARLDPSDVVQEAQLAAARRIDDFLQRRPMPFRLWLRKTAYERLLDLQRHHLGRARRSVGREVALPDRSSLLLARPLLAGGPSPSEHLAGREFAERVSRAVATLSAADREVLLLRHAEGLPFEEVACVLGVQPAAARKRFGRALLRLQKALTEEGLLE
jgi:RNA polymerase sigma-70 factor (ECF subfamily)